MTNTKANVIELLKKMNNNTYRLVQAVKRDGDFDHADRLMGEMIAYDNCIELLTDNEFFQTIAEIYSDK